MIGQLIDQFRQPRTWVEILVLGITFYFILTFIRGTRGAGILKGIVFFFIVAFLGLMYLADLAELVHIKSMLQWLLSISALALLIIFAPEIRRALSHLAQSPLLSPLLRAPSSRVVEELSNAAVKLSKNRIGALIAIERDVGLAEYVENGCRLDALLTSELLETLFYPGSALHDGAVVLQHDRVAAAGCLFPLTDDTTLSKSMGTRHRAALGISEDTDAVALVVSEETGRISVAVNGKLTGDLNRESLAKLLGELLSKPGGNAAPSAPPPAAPGAGPVPPAGKGPSNGNGNGISSPAPDRVEEKKP
jgi:diadenylate cyclase